jgi:salicylate hydroxylase
MLAQGEGTMIAEADAASQAERVTSIVHRAAFLRELLAGIPERRMHVSRKLEKVDGQGGSVGPLTLRFNDGTTHECDILIGADGSE